MKMNRFYIGCQIYSIREQPFDKREWVRRWKPELFEWIIETVGEKWRFDTEIENNSFDVMHPRLVEIFIIYDHDCHAVLHKLRWGQGFMRGELSVESFPEVCQTAYPVNSGSTTTGVPGAIRE